MKVNYLIYILLTTIIIGGCNNQTKKESESHTISAILSLSGNASTLGEYAKHGIELAVKEKNNSGGLLGKPIKVEFGDSQSLPKEGVNIVQKHLNQFDPLLVYSQLSSISLAVKPITEKENKLMFALSGADNLLSSSNSTFRNWLPPLETAKELTRLMKDSLSIKEFGILFSNGEFSRSMKDAAVSQGQKLGMNIQFTEIYDETGSEFKTTVLKCLSKNPRNIYVVGIGKSLGTIIRELRDNGFNGTILGDATMSLPDVKNTAGSTISGAYYIDFGFSTDSKLQNTVEFRERFVNEYSKDPQTLSAISYDAMNIIFDAVEKTGKTESKELIAFLNKNYNYQGVFGEVKISNFDIIYPMSLKQYK